MKPREILKSIAEAIKTKEELAGVSCIYANPRDVSENPVCGFTLCLGTGKVKYQSCAESVCSTKLELCLLAPSGAGGRRLCEVAFWISETLKDSFNAAVIEISEPRYNEVTAVLYADIAVTVEEESLAEEVCSLYIGGVLAEGLTAVSVESSELWEKVGQLLEGYSYVKAKGETYIIKLRTDRQLKLMQSEFELGLEFEDYNETYSGCFLNSIKKELNKSGELSFCYEIVSGGYELSERGAV